VRQAERLFHRAQRGRIPLESAIGFRRAHVGFVGYFL
jgi:hypothetical protein